MVALARLLERISSPLQPEDDAPDPTDALAYAEPLGDYDLPSDPHFLGAIYAGPYFDPATGTWYRPPSPRTERPCAPEVAWSEWGHSLAGGGWWDYDNQARVEGPNGPLQRLRDGRAQERAAGAAVDGYIRRRGAREDRFAILVWAMYFREGLRVRAIAARMGRSAGAVRQVVKHLCIAAGHRALSPRALRPRRAPALRGAAPLRARR